MKNLLQFGLALIGLYIVSKMAGNQQPIIVTTPGGYTAPGTSTKGSTALRAAAPRSGNNSNLTPQQLAGIAQAGSSIINSISGIFRGNGQGQFGAPTSDLQYYDYGDGQGIGDSAIPDASDADFDFSEDSEALFA